MAAMVDMANISDFFVEANAGQERIRQRVLQAEAQVLNDDAMESDNEDDNAKGTDIALSGDEEEEEQEDLDLEVEEVPQEDPLKTNQEEEDMDFGDEGKPVDYNENLQGKKVPNVVIEDLTLVQKPGKPPCYSVFILF
jgi:hypothetical protein